MTAQDQYYVFNLLAEKVLLPVAGGVAGGVVFGLSLYQLRLWFITRSKK